MVPVFFVWQQDGSEHIFVQRQRVTLSVSQEEMMVVFTEAIKIIVVGTARARHMPHSFLSVLNTVTHLIIAIFL